MHLLVRSSINIHIFAGVAVSIIITYNGSYFIREIVIQKPLN